VALNGRERRVSPLVKWAGGKTSLLPHVIARLREASAPPGATYFEPFLGGGAVFFALQPERAVVSDTNRDLVQMYTIVRDEPEALMGALDDLQQHVLDSERYYAIRSQDPSSLPAVDAAARFIYLNKTCYNGLYRVNRRGQFNVPFGRYRVGPRLYDRANLLAASDALRRASVLCVDYHEALREAKAGDIVYLDPPYHPLSATANFTGYTALAFGEGNQRALVQEIRRLSELRAFVLLSNSDTPLIHELYGEYALNRLAVSRAINSRGDRRTGTFELLIDNYGLIPKKSRSQSSRSPKATALPVDSKYDRMLAENPTPS
jgi:DNA adenine methylase